MQLICFIDVSVASCLYKKAITIVDNKGFVLFLAILMKILKINKGDYYKARNCFNINENVFERVKNLTIGQLKFSL